MKLELDNITIETKQDSVPKYTEKYVALLSILINKGIEDPACQLQVLSLITTGRPFIQLVSNDLKSMDQIFEATNKLMEGILDNGLESSKVEKSGITIEEFLEGFNKEEKDEEES